MASNTRAGNSGSSAGRGLVAVAAFGFLAVVVTSCGDQGLLDGVGDRTREVVYEGVTSTTVFQGGLDDDLASLGAGDSRQIAWYNDAIEDQTVGVAEATVTAVWERGKDTGRFIQSSRAEIASALPQIQFPRLVPPEVVTITSQLVFDASSGTLGQDTSAAFGLWPVVPYTIDDGQSAVLRVGANQYNIPEGEVVIDLVGLGISLEWATDGYRYELFCRQELAEGLCQQMVDSMEPLATITPVDASS